MSASAPRLVSLPVRQAYVPGQTSGEKLRTARHQLNLTIRQVALETRRIAEFECNEEFAISPGRLCEVENKGVVPNIYRLYSLALVYKLDLRELLSWFGVPNES